jgi:UDP-glucose 4-epimerase
MRLGWRERGVELSNRMCPIVKVLVVGGAGYIGSHAVYEMIRAGHQVVVMDDLSTGSRAMVHPAATFRAGDICVPGDLRNVFVAEQRQDAAPFDVVLHFAAKLVVPESFTLPLEYYHNNVEGVRLMLSAMTDFDVRNVVFSSTAAVYGNPDGGGTCVEDTPARPINPYGATKLAAEELIRWVCAAYDMNFCIFRYFNVAGADASLDIGLMRDHVTHLIPVALQTGLGLRPSMTVHGSDYPTPDGTCIRDYVHVTDVAKAHVLGAQYLVERNASLLANLGSGNGFSVNEVLAEAERHIHVPHTYGERRAGDPAKLIASNQLAKSVLGWEPTLDLSDMIMSDLAFRRQPISL